MIPAISAFGAKLGYGLKYILKGIDTLEGIADVGYHDMFEIYP